MLFLLHHFRLTQRTNQMSNRQRIKNEQKKKKKLRHAKKEKEKKSFLARKIKRVIARFFGLSVREKPNVVQNK